MNKFIYREFLLSRAIQKYALGAYVDNEGPDYPVCPDTALNGPNYNHYLLNQILCTIQSDL